MAGSTDVIVIGAGIIGCAVAHELARRGASVVIMDDRPEGMGATQASAGVLAPYIEAREGSALLDLTVRSLDLFDDFAARLSTVRERPFEYRRTGTLEVALTDETLQEYRQRAGMLARRAVAAELLDRQAVQAAEPFLSTDALGGLLIPSHGFVGAISLTHALAAAARREGAKLRQGARACRVRRAGRDLAIDTGRETLTAGHVVLAAGSWAGALEIDDSTARVPVRPVRGQLLQLQWHGAPLQRVTWSDRSYMVPWHDGTLLVGATVEEAGFDERTTTAAVRDLIEAACEVVPHAWTAALAGARAGLRPCTIDELPLIGRSTVLPNLMYATGHYRNGVLLAPLTAQLVADALLDARNDPVLATTGPQRFGAL